MKKWQGSVVPIQKYFFYLTILTCIGCFFKFVEYEVYNNSGRRVKNLVYLNVLIEASKNTLVRVIVLLISLGYGIVMNVLRSYLTKICLLSFFYFVTNAINVGLFYISEQRQLSKSIQVSLEIPEIALNCVFLLWIGKALLRTLSYLKQKQQDFKLDIMKQFSIVIIFFVLVRVIIVCSIVIYHLFSNRDSVWKNDYFFRILYSLVFFVALSMMLYIFRP